MFLGALCQMYFTRFLYFADYFMSLSASEVLAKYEDQDRSRLPSPIKKYSSSHRFCMSHQVWNFPPNICSKILRRSLIDILLIHFINSCLLIVKQKLHIDMLLIQASIALVIKIHNALAHSLARTSTF